MKRLDWYVIRDLFLPFMASTIVFSSLFMVNELIALLKFQVAEVPASAIFQLAMFAMPKWIVIVLPVGMSLAVSLVCSRMVRESELTALRSAGIRIARAFAPLIVTALILTGTSFYLVERVVPWANKQHSIRSRDFLNMTGRADFLSNVPVVLGRYLAKFNTLQRNRDGTLELGGIFLHEEVNNGEHIFYIAHSGKYEKGIWTLRSAQIYWVAGSQLVAVNTKDVTINQKVDLDNLVSDPSIEDDTIQGLMQQISEAKAIGRDARKMEANLHERFVSPLTCSLFAIMSAYSAVRFAKLGPFVGVFLSTVWSWLYFNFHVVAKEIVAAHGWLPAPIAIWIPLGVFSVICIGIVRGCE